MVIFSYLFEILITYIEGFVLLLFLNALFYDENRKNNIALTALCSAAYTIVITAVNYFSLVSAAGGVLMTLMLSAETALLNKCRYFSALAASAVVTSLQVLFEMLVICIAGAVAGDPDFVLRIISLSDTARIAYVIFIKAAVILIYFLSKKRLILLRADIFDSGIMRLTAAAAFFISIKMTDFLKSNQAEELKMGLSIMFVGFMAVIVLIVIVVQRLAEKEAAEKEKNFSDIKDSLLSQNLKNIYSLYSEKSKKIHDFNHHIDVIKTLAKENRTDKLGKYIDEISETPDFNQIFVSENEIINIIINVKMNDIADKNIRLNYDINAGRDIGIDDSDLCSILVNILDNAAEAAEKESDKTISLFIDERGSLVYISSENCCSKNPITNNFLSNKSGSHGWGTKIIADIVKKYNGNIEYNYSGNRLKIDVILTKKSKKITTYSKSKICEQ